MYMLIYNPRLFSHRTLGKRRNDHLKSSKANFQSSFQSDARWSVRSYSSAFFSSSCLKEVRKFILKNLIWKKLNKFEFNESHEKISRKFQMYIASYFFFFVFCPDKEMS